MTLNSLLLTLEGANMDNDALLLTWSQFQRAESCVPDTIKEREIALRALLRRSGKSLLDIHRIDLIADLARDIKPRTRANYRSLYHTFFTWLQDEGYRQDCPAARLPRAKVTYQEPNPVKTEDIEFLLNSGIYGKTRLYVLLYAYQGFRPVEIAAVSGESIDYQGRRIFSLEGKGGKEVWRPLHPLVWSELQKYPKVGPLFASPLGGHVGRKNVSNVLSQAFKRAGIHHRPHNLRAWFATEQLESGISAPIVQATMRHTDAQSIRHYYRPSAEAMAAALACLPLVTVPTKSGRRAA
jgi:integrase/recombinase XerD